MLTILTFAGLAIAVIVFFNLLQAKDKVARDRTNRYRGNGPPRVAVSKRLAGLKETDSSKPRARVCPLCGTVLAQDDYLFAALGEDPDTNGKRQAQIYGCRYCFTTDGVALTSQAEERPLTRIEP